MSTEKDCIHQDLLTQLLSIGDSCPNWKNWQLCAHGRISRGKKMSDKYAIYLPNVFNYIVIYLFTHSMNIGHLQCTRHSFSCWGQDTPVTRVPGLMELTSCCEAGCRDGCSENEQISE